MAEPNMLKRFEETVLPHLAAAYNLARWLIRNDHDAEDLVQEAYLRALNAFDGFRGGDARAWMLTIVRNTCYTWLRQNRMEDLTEVYDEELHAPEHESSDPERSLLETENSQLLKQALEDLPVEFREALVLRELENMSYREIADLMCVPVGTVMSRLARGRERLQRQLSGSRRRPERGLPRE